MGEAATMGEAETTIVKDVGMRRKKRLCQSLDNGWDRKV